MTQLEEIQEVFREVFVDDTLVIGPETTANDIDAWDSLMHVTLMLSVEERMGVKFSTMEIATLKNVGALCDLIERKKAAQK